MEYVRRLNELKSIIQQYFQSLLERNDIHSSNNYQDLKNSIDEWGKNATEIGSDLEISFRNIFQDYLIMFTETDSIEDSQAIQFVKFSIDFAILHHTISNAFAKIPFLLIEDLLECQTIRSAKKIWKIIESLVEKITQPNLFSKGKFVVLKTCNSLLRKLSKSYDTEFCGRILMFLTAVYPISERSALNLSGKINVGNVTFFDNKEKYLENVRDLGSEYHASEESKENVMKSLAEDGEEVDPSKIPFIITYEVYESFWKLQSSFASELKGFDPVATWNDFMNTSRKVFEIFKKSNEKKNHNNNNNENNKSGKDKTKDLRSASFDLVNEGEKVTEENEEYFGSKYLTSSQLFSLQLRDPLLRKQIAVQFLYFAHYLKVKAIPAVEGNENKNKFGKDLLFLHDQAKELIEQSTPNSKNFLETIQRILDREEHWISWKTASCVAFEKFPNADNLGLHSHKHKRKFNEMETEDKQQQEQASQSQSSQVNPELPSATTAAVIKEENTIPMLPTFYEYVSDEVFNKRRSFLFDCSQEKMKELAKNLYAAFPDFESQIQLYLDADDPSAGIEDEYHPKHDQLYCWRTRRLLAERHLSLFKHMSDGNLGKGLRILKHLPEPEPPANSAMDESEDHGAGNHNEMDEEEVEEGEEKKTPVIPSKSNTTTPRANANNNNNNNSHKNNHDGKHQHQQPQKKNQKDDEPAPAVKDDEKKAESASVDAGDSGEVPMEEVEVAEVVEVVEVVEVSIAVSVNETKPAAPAEEGEEVEAEPSSETKMDTDN